MVVGPDNSRTNGVITTGMRCPRPYSRYSPHLHSFHLTLFAPVALKTGAAPPILRPRSHSSTPHGPPSLVPLPAQLPQFLSFPPPPPQKQCPLRHGSSGSRGRPRGTILTSCLRTTQLTLTPFWWTVDSRWCLATSMPTIPPGSLEQKMSGQQPKGKRLMGRSTVHTSLLRTKASLLDSPPRTSLPRQISPF